MCRPRSTFLSLALITATIAAGLSVRFAHLRLPYCVVKFGGSALWALASYWIVSAWLPSRRIWVAASVSAALAAGIECVKLVHLPALDAFRATLPGVLLLGRFFSLWDILAYWAAIAIGVLIEPGLRSPRRPVP